MCIDNDIGTHEVDCLDVIRKARFRIRCCRKTSVWPFGDVVPTAKPVDTIHVKIIHS